MPDVVERIAPVVPIKPPVEVKQAEIKVVNEPPRKIPTEVAISQADDSLNWSELAFELKLGGIARQIAVNTVVDSYTDGQLHLFFLPSLEVMLKADIESQIKQAIEDKLEVSLQLTFSSKANLDTETPHQADVRKQEQHRQQVIQTIKQDPVVVQLKTVFGAELIEDSVKKIH